MKRRERTRNILVRVERFWILGVLYLPFEMTATHPFSVVYFFFFIFWSTFDYTFSLWFSGFRSDALSIVFWSCGKKTKRSTRKSGNAWCCCCCRLVNCSAMFVTFKLFTLGHTWCWEGSKTYSLFSGNLCHFFFWLDNMLLILKRFSLGQCCPSAYFSHLLSFYHI